MLPKHFADFINQMNSEKSIQNIIKYMRGRRGYTNTCIDIFFYFVFRKFLEENLFQKTWFSFIENRIPLLYIGIYPSELGLCV